MQISSRAFQRVFTCKIWLRYSRERASDRVQKMYALKDPVGDSHASALPSSAFADPIRVFQSDTRKGERATNGLSCPSSPSCPFRLNLSHRPSIVARAITMQFERTGSVQLSGFHLDCIRLHVFQRSEIHAKCEHSGFHQGQNSHESISSLLKA